ncbi:hypothetical protein UM93_02155 [Psychromicrobium lacuslunae]|uniref:Uncharacterized protein n=1 Tax=Psychromicrobium lacuslunae TaxID=1618207 RepID=A0A0D4BWZ4_9MICC|nr:hypothetical protein UM93_02155 [Psychromicrobium lacuslunae]
MKFFWIASLYTLCIAALGVAGFHVYASVVTGKFHFLIFAGQMLLSAASIFWFTRRLQRNTCVPGISKSTPAGPNRG